MSLVQTIITDDYAMLCSDTKAYTLEGTHVDNSTKVVKISDTVMFGCTGKVSDNYELFGEYCECDGIRYTPKHFESPISYDEVMNHLLMKYENMQDKFDAGTPYEVCSVVCGYNEFVDDFEISIFSLHTDSRIRNGVNTFRKLKQYPYRIATCGNLNHGVKLDNMAEDAYTDSYQPLTILQWKNMFKDVLRSGVSFDSSINDKAKFVVIRKTKIDNGELIFKCRMS